MTQIVFADYIEVSAATLSGIFNNRTKPTLNIVEAIRKKIPDLNINWLIFGEGDMFIGQGDAGGSSDTSIQAAYEGALPFADDDGSAAVSGHAPYGPGASAGLSSPTSSSAGDRLAQGDPYASRQDAYHRQPSRDGGPASRGSSGVGSHRGNPFVEVNFSDKNFRKITEIRVYYDDKTWESFVPSK